MHHRPLTTTFLLAKALLISTVASASEMPKMDAVASAPAGATSQHCYDPANIGKIGASTGCKDMLIISREMMLRDVTPINGGTDMGIVHAETGRAFTYGDSADNVFTGQINNLGAGIVFEDGLAPIGMPEILLPHSFNADIGYWDVSNVEDMSFLFGINGLSYMGGIGSHFNHDISDWDMRNVADTTGMLAYMVTFDQPIGKWKLSSAEKMSGMLYASTRFNQDLSEWNVEHLAEEPLAFADETPSWVLPKPCWGETPSSCINASADEH